MHAANRFVFDEEQILAAVLNDDTGAKLAEARVLTGDAFQDSACRALWEKLLSLPDGKRPDEVLIGCGLDADTLHRITRETTSPLNFTAHVLTIMRRWTEAKGKLLAADLQKGVITLDQLSKGLEALAAPVPDKQAWPEPVSAFDLCAKPPPTPDVLIDGVLYRGGTMLISGPSKAHKTFAQLDASIAIASGGEWLGFKTVQTPVLYLNLELQGFATAKRVEKICATKGIRRPADLHLWNLRGRRVTLAELQQRLPEKIKRLGVGLVVIDPHYKISAVSGGEENSNDSQGLLLGALEGLCGLNGAALAISHHFAKGDASMKNAIDRASGGGVFARWGDVMMTFTPHEEEEAMTVEMALRNFAPVEPFVVRWEHPLWHRDSGLDPANLKRSGGAKVKHSVDDVLTKLGHQQMTFTQWHKVTGLAETTFRRKANELKATGKVREIGIFYEATTP